MSHRNQKFIKCHVCLTNFDQIGVEVVNFVTSETVGRTANLDCTGQTQLHQPTENVNMGKSNVEIEPTPDDAVTKEDLFNEVLEDEPNPCCLPCVCLYTQGAPDSRLQLMLRIIGSITLAVAILELGLGGGLFNFLENVKTGAWWVGLITFCAGTCGAVSLNRDWVLAGFVLSIASCITAVVGAALDGVASHSIRAITACASKQDNFSDVIYYGLSRDYPGAQQCLFKTGTIESNGCSCVTRNNDCRDLFLSEWAKFYKKGCVDIINNYSFVLATSTAICTLCFVMAAILAIVSAIELFSPLKKRPDNENSVPAKIPSTELTPEIVT